MAENSTDDNSNHVDMDDLDSFEDAFFGRVKIPEAKAPEQEEDLEVEDDSLATDEDTHAEPEDETPEEDEGEPKAPEPKKNRKSAKERIEELVGEARSAERERDAEKAARLALEQRLAALEAQKPVEQKAPEAPVEPNAPDPNALDHNGQPVYALGEFDPKFVRDLTKFTVEQETKAYEEKQKAIAEAQKAAEQDAKLRSEWEQKVTEVEKELPDYREQIGKLGQAFGNLEPKYGNYLATTIMACDNGPEIMYYLSQNIGEAQRIVASGPFAATLEIGRLQAKLERPARDESNSPKKNISQAPTPPTERVRGRGGQFAVRGDTDDLDAFEKEFFKQARR